MGCWHRAREEKPYSRVHRLLQCKGERKSSQLASLHSWVRGLGRRIYTRAITLGSTGIEELLAALLLSYCNTLPLRGWGASHGLFALNKGLSQSRDGWTTPGTQNSGQAIALLAPNGLTLLFFPPNTHTPFPITKFLGLVSGQEKKSWGGEGKQLWC